MRFSREPGFHFVRKRHDPQRDGSGVATDPSRLIPESAPKLPQQLMIG